MTSVVLFLITWARYSRSISYLGCVYLPVVLSLDYYWHLCGWDWPSGCLMWGLAMTTTFRFLYETWLHGAEFTLPGSGACWDHCLGMTLVKLIWLISVVSLKPALCWVWNLLGWFLVQAKFRHCLWPAQGYLAWATKSSEGNSCLSWLCRSMGEAITWTTPQVPGL